MSDFDILAYSKFPPNNWKSWFARYEEYAAWYSGDPTVLANYYASIVGSIEGKFWGMTERRERATMMHVPLANDISMVSASLLFSETPEIKTSSEETTKEINRLLESINFVMMCSEAAEIASSMSGVMLKLDVDEYVSKDPICSLVSPLSFIPYFYRGYLQSVHFFSTVYEDELNIYRLVEKRQVINGKLVIKSELYKGDPSTFGSKISLKTLIETSEIPPVVELDTNLLGCVYIPNKKPNLLLPGSPLGVSDYHNVISMMDCLDEVWTSWVRDIRLAKSRLFLDQSLLDENKKFSIDKELFQEIDLSEVQLEASMTLEPIKMVQFAIRAAEHYQTAETLSKEIISRSGYSPQTFGYDMKTYTESGAAMRIKERKSLMTRETKERYWNYGLKNFIYQLQVFAKLMEQSLTPEYPILSFADSIVPDISVTAESLRAMKDAKAVSTYTAVKMAHPEWEETSILEEVERIKLEAEEEAKRNVKIKIGEQDSPEEDENVRRTESS